MGLLLDFLNNFFVKGQDYFVGVKHFKLYEYKQIYYQGETKVDNIA